MPLLSALLPKLQQTSYKGQSGKVAVLGGSEEYTGAPYYAAIAALRTGADLSHIFTPAKEALQPLKTYSPELIVHEADGPEKVNAWAQALHSLVIGPGLGRNQNLEAYLAGLIEMIN